MSMGFIPKLICAAIIALPSYLPVPNQEQTVLAEIKENQQDITLSATTKSVPGMYCGIAFTWNNRTKIFPWESISEPAFYPEVIITNIDDKGQDEAIIILTTGKGTGARGSAIHVLQEDWTEIPVGDPIVKAQNSLSSTYKDHEATVEYTVNIAGKEYVYSYPFEDAEMWFDEASIGRILRYRVQENKLIAEMPVQVSPGTYTGTIEVEYREYNGELLPSEVSYIEDL
ncbi:hypothetical protein [Paenibacillus sp. 7516]|uniref:hypothetical protein n=1 Tax=Paenibacillus sp. 7516 TaxID=2022549 RepID=UPI000BA67189|nr:hypothetical protein [Paenibacillus sp. 7516]PAF31212.1 hypothetical protein CHI14_11825 [Paenibacillus sp. 7516]